MPDGCNAPGAPHGRAVRNRCRGKFIYLEESNTMKCGQKTAAALLALLLTLTALSVAVPAVAAGTELLTLNKTTYTEGEDILVTATGSGADWVGLYAASDGGPGAGKASIYWYYVAKDGNTSGGQKSIRDAEYRNERGALLEIPAGDYVMFLCSNDGYTVLAQVAFTVKLPPEQTPDAPASAVYTSAGAGAGRADGTLTVTEGAGSVKPESYVAYWANADGVLPGWSAAAAFARTGATTTVRLADNSLIPAGADRLLVFARRENTDSARGTEALLPAGAADFDPGKLLGELQVMSDIHLNASDDHLHNRHFAQALADIRSLSPDSMGIFINGDIADHGLTSEYEAFNRLIAQAGDGLPAVLCSIGNHDFSGGLSAKGQIQRFLKGTGNSSETVWFDTWIGGYHFVFLGGEAAGLYADLSETQLTWLNETLAKDRAEGRPTFLFLHQGLMDTVAGTFQYQDWHGVKQSDRLHSILKQYPEVVLFSGHSHWTMESEHTVKPADSKLPAVVSTASCAYLWDDDCMATNVGIVGSEGYYLYLYEDYLIIRGRSYDRGEWIGSAQFVLSLKSSGGTETETVTETTAEPATDTAPEPDSDTEPATDTETAKETETETATATGADTVTTGGTTVPDPTDTTAGTTADSAASGCSSALGGALGSVGVLALGGAALSRRRRRNRK